MRYKNILVTGGAGFVGSNICLKFKEYFNNINVIAFDNLFRKGSELNVPRLKKKGVTFIKGDVRFKSQLKLQSPDLIIECSAEPSVMAGVKSSPEYLLDTNLTGAINCFELARKSNADIVFLSTSRVYPVKKINALKFKEEKTRYTLENKQTLTGSSKNGISEEFPIDGVRTLYGSTKLSAELLLAEYIENYGISGIINRCGVITGPWQMGKIDQGVIVYWIARHFFKKPLSYIGFNGSGKQVRDVIDVDDLFELLFIQIKNISRYSGKTFNVGGGIKNSISLLELTEYARKLTRNVFEIKKEKQDRQGDIRVYLSDCKKIREESSWAPKKTLDQSFLEIYKWIFDNKNLLEKIIS